MCGSPRMGLRHQYKIMNEATGCPWIGASIGVIAYHISSVADFMSRSLTQPRTSASTSLIFMTTSLVSDALIRETEKPRPASAGAFPDHDPPGVTPQVSGGSDLFHPHARPAYTWKSRSRPTRVKRDRLSCGSCSGLNEIH